FFISENERPCLEFSHLNILDSIKDLFIPKMNIVLMLYTRNSRSCAEPLFEQDNSLNVNFNTSKKTVWIIHGYRPTGSTPAWLQNFLKVLLTYEDLNVIVVDWNRAATTFLYSRAVKNTRKVAASLGIYIQTLLSHGASLDNFHFIGMSLGAHLSGFVGKIFQGQLGRITGLDPAGPRFSGQPYNQRLDYTDAKFVDVIHSDTDGLGINEPLGHIDFYPNGGKKQPGCPTSIFSGISYIKCHHQRAVYLFMASLETTCHFISFPCPSYKDFQAGSCVDCDDFKEKSCPRLGNKAEQWKNALKERKEKRFLRTTVFLDTTGTRPFCSYYFVLSITVLDNSMKNGFITFKLLNQVGIVEESKIYEKNRSFYHLKEVKILAQFSNDVRSISGIGLGYFQNSNQQCSQCSYNIHRVMVQSITYQERPPLCIYNFVLKGNEEVFLSPSTCTSEDLV
ncbi:LIPI Lipase, partial [Crocuta crocuta]